MRPTVSIQEGRQRVPFGTFGPPDWALLPDAIRGEVEARAGSGLTSATVLGDGLHPGLRMCLTLARGSRLLLTCLPADHPLVPRYRDEAATNRQLTGRVPILPLRHAWQSGDWWLMAFHDLTAARHPDLTPGSPDIARALALIDRLTTSATPSPLPDAPGFADTFDGELGGWRHLADTATHLDPWTARNLDRLTATEQYWRHYTDGTTLLHADLGPDTMLLANAGDVVTDWAYPHHGSAWIEAAMFLPHLIHAGHTPQQAEHLMKTSVTAWTGAPPEALTFLAIALTGYWERTCRLPTPPGAPYLRLYQAQMATIGQTWIQHRTQWD